MPGKSEGVAVSFSGNTMQPKISVIIPAFNAEKFIAEAIKSVLAQKYNQRLEIIVIDDGSTDNTGDVVSEISAEHPQIVLVSNERKKGPSGSRNTGLLKAKGDYISFLDADDVWLENHLQEGVEFLEKHQWIDIVYFNFEIYEYESKRRIGDGFSQKQFTSRLKVSQLGGGYFQICDDMFAALVDDSFMHLQALIIRKKTIGTLLFDENIKRSEDRDFCIRLYSRANACFAYKNIITGIYYLHNNSLTSNSIQNTISTLSDHIYLFSESLARVKPDSLLALKLRKMLSERYIGLSYNYRQLNHHILAMKFFLKSIVYKRSKVQLKEVAKILGSFVLYHTFDRARRK